MSWLIAATVGTGLLGAGASMYGANKQAKDNAKAREQNRADQEAQRKQEWINYLIQRGVNPGANAETGVIPVNAPAVNTRMPLWMKTPVTTTPGGPAVRRIK